MKRKGIILAGGLGSRLYPASNATNKQLLPVYDKPMIYYPLSTLMLAGIQDICIVCPSVRPFMLFLGNGERWGIKLSYVEQRVPDGIAHGLLVAEEFIAEHPVCLILGDNIFYGHGLSQQLQHSATQTAGATIYAYPVNDPKRYGVVKVAANGDAMSIEEKPKEPKSNLAVTGIYFYDKRCVDYARTLKPSDRGELEITDLNDCYLRTGELDIEFLGRGMAWLDAGTPDSLMDAGNFVRTIEKRQGLKVGCPEEIAWRQGWITSGELWDIMMQMPSSDYNRYLMDLVANEDLPCQNVER